MPPIVASLLFWLVIFGLFFLDRDSKLRTSKALWIPVMWLLINGSRPVSLWMQGSAPVLQADQYLEGSPIDRNVYALIEALGLLVLLARRQKVGEILKGNGPTILFFTYCFVSVFWSDYPDVSFKRWTKALGDLEMALIVLTEADPLAAVKRLLTRVGFVLMPLSVLFIKYYPDLGRVYNQWTWTYTYVGVTSNKNELGMICMIVALGSVWRLLLARHAVEGWTRRRHVIAHLMLLTMTAYLFWMANSMTSLSCLLMASGVLFVTGLRPFAGKPGIVHALVGGAVSLALFALFVDAGGSLLEGMGRDATLTGRTDIWKGLIDMVVNPLVGAGYESFWLGSRLTSSRSLMWRLNQAHNGYLEVYLNLGWIGVLLLATMIVSGYRHVLAVFRHDPGAGRIRVAYFTAAVIYCLTEAGFRLTSPTWIIFLLVTIAVPLRKAVTAPAQMRQPLAVRLPELRPALSAGTDRKSIEAFRRQQFPI